MCLYFSEAAANFAAGFAGIHSARFAMSSKAFALLLALLLFCPLQARAESLDWPPGLKDVVINKFTTLQTVEFAIRDSDQKAPAGIVPTFTFDRPNHSCHEASGQAYRVYGEPYLFGRDEDGSYLVRVSFTLFYREAITLDSLFASPWKEGSPGALEVKFTREDEFWKASKGRELSSDSKPKAHEAK
jgi:hypothetical protein